MSDSQDNKFVMVVEDDRLLLDAITKSLEANKINAKGFLTGIDAFKYLEENEDIPSLIWLDYFLGDTNGMAFLKILHGKNAWKEIPVIIISAHDLGEKVSELKLLGVDRVLRKDDHSMTEMVSVVEEILKR
jgi:DNA-binding response OmpR family regulator